MVSRTVCVCVCCDISTAAAAAAAAPTAMRCNRNKLSDGLSERDFFTLQLLYGEDKITTLCLLLWKRKKDRVVEREGCRFAMVPNQSSTCIDRKASIGIDQFSFPRSVAVSLSLSVPLSLQLFHSCRPRRMNWHILGSILCIHRNCRNYRWGAYARYRRLILHSLSGSVSQPAHNPSEMTLSGSVYRLQSHSNDVRNTPAPVFALRAKRPYLTQSTNSKKSTKLKTHMCVYHITSNWPLLSLKSLSFLLN